MDKGAGRTHNLRHEVVSRMIVDIGVFAHNEADHITHLVEDLRRQTLLSAGTIDVRVLILANGCTDSTVAVATTAAAGDERIAVADLAQGGKSRTWNRFVHELSRPEAELLLFCDADIGLPDESTMERLVRLLAERPELVAAPSRPVKDIVYAPAGGGAPRGLIAASGGGLDDWRISISGQLYAARASAVRGFHLPIGLPVEDGFVRAMLLTNVLTEDEDLSLIDGDERAFHVYESETKVPNLLRHQRRIVIGSAINTALFTELRDAFGANPREALAAAAGDEQWVARTIRKRLPRWYGFVPTHFLFKRVVRYFNKPTLQPKAIVTTAAGFGFDAVAYLMAQVAMARGVGAGHW